MLVCSMQQLWLLDMLGDAGYRDGDAQDSDARLICKLPRVSVHGMFIAAGGPVEDNSSETIQHEELELQKDTIAGPAKNKIQ